MQITECKRIKKFKTELYEVIWINKISSFWTELVFDEIAGTRESGEAGEAGVPTKPMQLLSQPPRPPSSHNSPTSKIPFPQTGPNELRYGTAFI